MTRNPKTILSEIKSLVDELEGTMGGPPSAYKKPSKNKQPSPVVVPKGAHGAIAMLIDEGFFNVPKEIAAVLEKLKDIGHYHDRTAIAMNLLNLTKRKVLNRFKNKETKNWEYVIRK